MEPEDSGKLCVLCCSSINSALSSSSSRKKRKSKVEPGEVTTFSKFCEQISVANWRSVDDVSARSRSSRRFPLSSSSRSPVCSECLVSVEKAATSREKAEVRSLQVQILKLRELQELMASYAVEMEGIQDKIERSDVTGMRIEDGFGDGQGLDASQLRDAVINAVKDLRLFQNQLSSKVNCSAKDSFTSSPTEQVKIEVEAAENEEEPQFEDLPCHGSPSSPPSSPPGSPPPPVESRKEPEPDINSDRPRRARRSTSKPVPIFNSDSEGAENDEDPEFDFQEDEETEEEPSSDSDTDSGKPPPRKIWNFQAKTFANLTPAEILLQNKMPAKHKRKRRRSGSSEISLPGSKKKVPSEPAAKMEMPSWIKASRSQTCSETKKRRFESERSYHCEICPEFIAKNPYHLEQHLREHELAIKDAPKMFTCSQCDVSFVLKQLYDFHMVCHGPLIKFMCHMCNRKQTPLELKSHFQQRHRIKELFECDNCSFCCSERHRYLEHLRTQHLGANVIMSCDLCPLKFTRRSEHLEHLHQVHGAIDTLKCEVEGCESSFLDKIQLIAHQVLHTRPFACLHCDKKFTSECALKRHQSAHTEQRPWPCSRCPQTFKTAAILKKHEELHDRDQDPVPAFQCHLCEKSYKKQDSLVAHVKLHEGQGYSCDKCGTLFGHKNALKMHMETHEDIKLTEFCDQCGKGFRSGRHLRTHLKRVHQNHERNHQCPDCDKTFLSKSNLKQHSRMHTGEKPYVCNVCGKGFGYSSGYHHHKKFVHPD